MFGKNLRFLNICTFTGLQATSSISINFKCFYPIFITPHTNKHQPARATLCCLAKNTARNTEHVQKEAQCCQFEPEHVQKNVVVKNVVVVNPWAFHLLKKTLLSCNHLLGQSVYRHQKSNSWFLVGVGRVCCVLCIKFLFYRYPMKILPDFFCQLVFQLYPIK